MEELTDNPLYVRWSRLSPSREQIHRLLRIIKRLGHLERPVFDIVVECLMLTHILDNVDVRGIPRYDERRELSKSEIHKIWDVLPDVRGKKLEEGRFGVIYGGTVNDSKVVFKMLADLTDMDGLMHEAIMGSFINKIDSPFFVKTLAYIEMPPPIASGHPKRIRGLCKKSSDRIPYLILESLTKNSMELGEFIYERLMRDDIMSIFKVFIQIFDALIEIYDKLHMTHGDIHQSNVMVIKSRRKKRHRLHTGGTLRSRWTAKIIDLGTSRIDDPSMTLIPRDVVTPISHPNPGLDMWRLLRVMLSFMTIPEQEVGRDIVHVINMMSSMRGRGIVDKIDTDGMFEHISEIHRIVSDHRDAVIDPEVSLDYRSAMKYLKDLCM